jgi:hypothetical protein
MPKVPTAAGLAEPSLRTAYMEGSRVAGSVRNEIGIRYAPPGSNAARRLRRRKAKTKI